MSADWLSTKEKGSLLGIRFLVWASTLLGRRPLAPLLSAIALYYTLTSRRARRTARDFLGSFHDRASFWDAYRNIRNFTQCSLDRLFFVQGHFQHFTVTRQGSDYLAALKERKSGAVLLGAHLGSYEALRMTGRQQDVPLNILGYFRNAALINRVLTDLNPDTNARVIDTGGDALDVALEARDCIERGEFIATMGDRMQSTERSASVDFLGRSARFPVGAYLLASLLRCPVYLVFGLYRGPNRYDLHCEPFADEIVLPRGRRDEALKEYAQQFADRLAHYCELAPDNWFNFYDFWKPAEQMPTGTE